MRFLVLLTSMLLDLAGWLYRARGSVAATAHPTADPGPGYGSDNEPPTLFTKGNGLDYI